MGYEIKIINIPPVEVQSGTSTISPSPTYIPNDCVNQYISDVSRSDGGFVSIPLYKRNQYANIPPNSILTIYTDDTSEIIYYKQLIVDDCSIEISDGGGGSTLIEKTITDNGVYNAADDGADGYSTVSVSVSGGGSNGEDVIFYDYDGTEVYRYSASEFANLEEFPSNPEHEGLTSQGWNWSLSDAKTYVSSYGALNIGQMYITDDGKTRIYITLTNGRLNPQLNLYLNGNSEVDIDWGDGSSHGTLKNTSESVSNEFDSHTYSSSGSYIIALTVVSGGFTIQGGADTSAKSQLLVMDNTSIDYSPSYSYMNSIKKVEIGQNASVGDRAFRYCLSLQTITLPMNLTSIGEHVFNSCSSLQSITLPNSLTSIQAYAFYDCFSINSIALPNSLTSIGDYAFNDCQSTNSVTLPNSLTSIGSSAFSNCQSLTSIALPNSLTSIGDNAFSSCQSIKSLTISSGVISIGNNLFYGCRSLESITIPDTVTSIGSNAFAYCYSLTSVTLPSGLTQIGSACFSDCKSLQSITIPDTVTSIGASAFLGCIALIEVTLPSGLTTIGNGAFNGCYSISEIDIPSTATSIGSYAFGACYSLAYVIIHKSSGSISGSPWGAMTGVPSYTQIIWDGD